MKKLLGVAEIRERYGCSEATARKYMRQMVHMEKPLRVTEDAVAAWEIERTYNPVDTAGLKAGRRSAGSSLKYREPAREGKFLIARKRPEGRKAANA